MTTRVLLAGAGGEAAGRHHQRDMFAPAIAASELLDVVGVWPGPVGACGGWYESEPSSTSGTLMEAAWDAFGPSL